jgi:plastocyanin
MKAVRSVLLGVGLAVVVAAPAAAAETVVTGLDTLTWDKTEVVIPVGDTVTWQFAGTTQNHNVQHQTTDTPDPNWNTFASAIGLPAPNASYTFNVDGLYPFVCIVHSGMTGVVKVGNAGAPPPVPLSAQRFGNDDASVFPVETVELDKAKPSLARVKARRAARGVLRVDFRVSEQSVVTARIKRGGKVVKTVTGDADGAAFLLEKRMKAGRYSVEFRAVDLAGNRSSMRKLALTVR